MQGVTTSEKKQKTDKPHKTFGVQNNATITLTVLSCVSDLKGTTADMENPLLFFGNCPNCAGSPSE